jgi:hypothetical protein
MGAIQAITWKISDQGVEFIQIPKKFFISNRQVEENCLNNWPRARQQNIILFPKTRLVRSHTSGVESANY